MSIHGQVCCVGELLIDFYCTDMGVRLQDGTNFEKQAGGAPANVTAAITRLGGKAAFVGRVGTDPFGDFLEQTLINEQVDMSLLQRDPDVRTTMAFVSLQKDGERDFVFSRGADEHLSMEELDVNRVFASEMLHFGSATAMLGGSAFETYFSLMDQAKAQGKLVTFDPNYRADLWPHLDPFISRAQQGIKKADFIKVSEEELSLVSGRTDRLEGIQSLHALGSPVIAVTLGKEGTLLSIHGKQVIIPSIAVQSIDSTGAGDAFVGAVLYQLSLHKDKKHVLENEEKMVEIITFANKVGAYVCTKMGAISALPTIHDIV